MSRTPHVLKVLLQLLVLLLGEGKAVSEGTNGTAQSVLTGRVKWFNDQKGYGFITQDNSPDVFVHHTAITMEGFRTLKEGEEVVFQILESNKGLQAVNVSRVE